MPNKSAGQPNDGVPANTENADFFQFYDVLPYDLVN